MLWIIAAAASAPMLRELGATRREGWPEGVYFVGGTVLRMGIVVASELPRDRSTLLVRIMAAGPGLAGAIAELEELPADAVERAVAEDVLLHLQQRLGRKPNPTPEEEEIIVAVQRTWAKARELGRAEGEARALLAALRVRGIPVPDAARERILAEKDPARIERWVERAVVAASLGEVLEEPS